VEDNIQYLIEVGFTKTGTYSFQKGSMLVNLGWGKDEGMIYLKDGVGVITASRVINCKSVFREMLPEFIKKIKLETLNSVAKTIETIQNSPSF
jgi:hypothetical protein